MQYCDLHLHSKHSFDGLDEILKLCAASAANNLSEIAITDHYDIFEMQNGINTYADDKIKCDIEEARSVYSDSMGIAYGVELGQPSHFKKEAESFLAKHSFDFVIGSLHNLKNVPDFYYMNYAEMPDKALALLWDRYLEELYELAGFCGINTLAHITYPLRYINRSCVRINVTDYFAEFSDIFKRLIDGGVSLELNTSGLRQDLGTTLPDFGLLKLYYDCGGRSVTCGSDAHAAADVGAGIKHAYELLRAAGFKYVTVYRGRCTAIPVD